MDPRYSEEESRPPLKIKLETDEEHGATVERSHYLEQIISPRTAIPSPTPTSADSTLLSVSDSNDEWVGGGKKIGAKRGEPIGQVESTMLPTGATITSPMNVESETTPSHTSTWSMARNKDDAATDGAPSFDIDAKSSEDVPEDEWSFGGFGKKMKDEESNKADWPGLIDPIGGEDIQGTSDVNRGSNRRGASRVTTEFDNERTGDEEPAIASALAINVSSDDDGWAFTSRKKKKRKGEKRKPTAQTGSRDEASEEERLFGVEAVHEVSLGFAVTDYPTPSPAPSHAGSEDDNMLPSRGLHRQPTANPYDSEMDEEVLPAKTNNESWPLRSSRFGSSTTLGAPSSPGQSRRRPKRQESLKKVSETSPSQSQKQDNSEDKKKDRTDSGTMVKFPYQSTDDPSISRHDFYPSPGSPHPTRRTERTRGEALRQSRNDWYEEDEWYDDRSRSRYLGQPETKSASTGLKRASSARRKAHELEVQIRRSSTSRARRASTNTYENIFRPRESVYSYSDYLSPADSSRDLTYGEDRRVGFSPHVEVIDAPLIDGQTYSGPPTESMDELTSDAESDSSYQFTLPTTDEKWAGPPNEPAGSQKLTLRQTTMGSMTGGQAALYHGIKKELKVVHSYYPDYDSGPNELAIGITAECENEDRHSGYDALFRWVHLEQAAMNFEGFIDCAISSPGISKDDMSAISRLLESFRNHSEKPFRSPHGQHGRYLAEGLAHDSLTGEQSYKSILFFCLPYLALEKIAAQPPRPQFGSHVNRTLLQTKFSSAGKDRELQQAVCHISHTPKQHCFHVPQLWCLLVGETLLLTCARAPFEVIQARSVQPTICMPKLSLAPQTQWIHVVSGRESWLLPARDCQTWFEFVAHFRELGDPWDNAQICDRDYCIADTGARCYALKHDNKTVEMKDWPNILQQSRSSQLRLNLITKLKPRSYEPPAIPESPAAPVDTSDNSSIDTDIWSDGTDGSNSDSSWTDPSPPPPEARSPRVYVYAPNPETPLDDNVQRGQYDDRTNSDSHLDVLQTPIQGINRTNTDLESSSFSVEEFHVFTWMAIKPSTVSSQSSDDEEPIYVVDGTQVNEALTLALKFLQKNPKPVEQHAFRHAPQKTLQNVRNQVKYMDRNSVHYGVYSAAKDILRFFLPLNFDAQVVLKYWGAVSMIIKNLHKLQPGDYSKLQDLAKVTRFMTTRLSAGHAPPVHKIRVPHKFIKSWLHCVSYFVLLGANPDSPLCIHHYQKCFNAVKQGREDILKFLDKSTLLKTEAVPPLVIVAKLCHRLLQDVADDQVDLISCYWTYLSQLELEIIQNPLQREHQRKIGLLKQELQAAQKTFVEQLSVMRLLKRKMRTRSSSTSYNSPREEPRELAINRECIYTVEAKMHELKDIYNRAMDLSSEHLRMIESNKDRQEAAIYIFTTVTVIFLPLTFVAGVLGMNTSDIRNMTIKQWVFWITAIPFTILVIATCLLFTGELSDFWLWLSKLRPKKQPSTRKRGGLVSEKPDIPPATKTMGSMSHLPLSSTSTLELPSQTHTRPPPRRRFTQPRYPRSVHTSHSSIYEPNMRGNGRLKGHHRDESPDSIWTTRTRGTSRPPSSAGRSRRVVDEWEWDKDGEFV